MVNTCISQWKWVMRKVTVMLDFMLTAVLARELIFSHELYRQGQQLNLPMSHFQKAWWSYYKGLHTSWFVSMLCYNSYYFYCFHPFLPLIWWWGNRRAFPVLERWVCRKTCSWVCKFSPAWFAFSTVHGNNLCTHCLKMNEAVNIQLSGLTDRWCDLHFLIMWP